MKKKLWVFLLAAILTISCLSLLIHASTSTASEETDVSMDSVSIVLSGKINMQFYVNFSSDMLTSADEYGLLFFDEECTEYIYANGTPMTDGVLQSDGTYKYVYAGIAAKEMSDLIYVRAYAKTGEDITYDQLYTTSVRNTAMQILDVYGDSTLDSSVALCDLVCQMLNYGAAAQNYFSYNTQDLANAGLTAAQKTIPTTEFASHYAVSGTATLPIFSIKTASLVLQDLTHFRFAVLAEGGDLDGVSLQMASDAAFTEIIGNYPLADCPVYAGIYRQVTTDGVVPADLDEVFYFRVTDGTNHSKTLAYSVESYAARMANTDGDLRVALYGMFGYANAVGDYIGELNDPNNVMLPAVSLRDSIRSSDLQENGTYTVSDLNRIVFSGDENAVYDGKNATIYTEGGLSFVGASNVTLKNLNIVMAHPSSNAIQVEGCTTLTLENVSINGACATVLLANGTTNGLMINSATFSATANTGIDLAAGSQNICILNSSVTNVSNLALSDASGAYVSGSTFSSATSAVLIAGDGAEWRSNTVSAPNTAIHAMGAANVLVALSEVTDGKMLMQNCQNSVFLLNNVAKGNVEAVGSTSAYVVENTLTLGTLTLTNNSYLLANGNAEGNRIAASGNSHFNGDDVTDINARLSVGADEDLLPHVNKEQFVGMARESYVYDPTSSVAYTVENYILTHAKNSDRVILAPGVYTVTVANRISFDAQRSNTTLYGYGAMLERSREGESNFGHLNFGGASNVSIKGLTMGHERTSTAQAYIVGKEVVDNKHILHVIAAPGFENEFGNSNPTDGYNANMSMGVIRAGEDHTFMEASFRSITVNESTGIIDIEVGVNYYCVMNVGDILTSKITKGGTVVNIANTTNLLFEDVVIYGTSSGFAFVEGETVTGTTFHRVANTTKSGAIISKATYDQFTAFEEQYGISFEMSIDAEGRYRGSRSYIGTADATHATGCGVGSQVISCLFENMCDDGTNQNANHARVGAITNNGDGTTTITYKGNYSVSNYDSYRASAGLYCIPFSVGDRVYVYTSEGQLICDTTALTATAQVMNSDGSPLLTLNQPMYDRAKINNPNVTEDSCKYRTYTVTVNTADVNFDAFVGYDLSDDSATNTGKVVIDNMSQASNGFSFDNTIVRNVRSRGLLIKASNGSITNCTFENIGGPALAILYEMHWGESGVTENLTVSKNLFDHTGYYGSDSDHFAPISIRGLGSSINSDYLLYNNINITDNTINNRGTTYAIYINSAYDITVKNNTFGHHVDTSDTTEYRNAIYINGASDVEVSGNTFPSSLSAPNYVKMNACLNIFGTDVAADDAFEDYLPTVNGTAVSYNGKWSLGYLPAATKPNGSNFTAYTTANASGVIGTNGSIDPANGAYRHAATASYNTVIAYTAPQNGYYSINLSDFFAPTANSGYLAVFRENGEMIWPNEGDYYTDASKWYTVTTATTATDLNTTLTTLDYIMLAQNEELYFCVKMADAVSDFGFLPVCKYASSTEAFVRDNENWPLYTSGVSFDGYPGNWSVGYLNGSSYVPYTGFWTTENVLIPSTDSAPGANGGMYITGRLALPSTRPIAISYEAPYAGNLALSFDYLMVSHTSAGTAFGCKVAIYKNGEKIWPTTAEAYVYSSQDTTEVPNNDNVEFLADLIAWAEANNDPLPTNVSVAKGDLIQFAISRTTSNRAACYPRITYVG